MIENITPPDSVVPVYMDPTPHEPLSEPPVPSQPDTEVRASAIAAIQDALKLTPEQLAALFGPA